MLLQKLEDAPPTHWDFVITCFEPLNSSSGGIGTYTRLLCEQLNSTIVSGANIRVLLLCGTEPDFSIRAILSNINIVVVAPTMNWRQREIHYIGDHQPRFSLALASTLMTLQAKGDSFGLIEFPDYFTEGFFPIKYIRHGFLRSGTTAIRLHSPSVMLFEDNCVSPSNYDTYRRYIIDMEMYCYKHCDIILYGASAMRDRVQSICSTFSVSVTDKLIHLRHPYLTPPRRGSLGANAANDTSRKIAELTALNLLDNPRLVAYVGRLETRKGIVKFFETLATSESAIQFVLNERVHFVLIGRDLRDENNNSNKTLITEQARRAGLQSNVHFLGNVDHNVLVNEVLPIMVGFVFPSLFENYPNALIETLIYGRPTLVSSRGGMMEIAAKYHFINGYDPFELNAIDRITAFLTRLTSPRASFDVDLIYDDFCAINGEVANAYLELISRQRFNPASIGRSGKMAGGQQRGTVGFVIPYFNGSEFIEGSLTSLSECRRPGDEIVVVDDASDEAEAQFLAALQRRYEFSIVRLPHNGGPSGARTSDTRMSQRTTSSSWMRTTCRMQLGFAKTRSVLDSCTDLDMVYGIQQNFGGAQHVWMPEISLS